MQACIFEWTMVCPEQYHVLINELDWHKKIPAGMLAYESCEKYGRLFVVDVWESTEAMNNYFNTILCQVLYRVGLPRPSVKYWSLDNYSEQTTILSSEARDILNKMYNRNHINN